ncbi:serine/threonine-protein kinase PLK4 isoform X1 [Erpetoichthys calabaricus]|uniref:serine/threonine-protein kinase PLK4 isoform X1 n=1 Tax=Erpetoichthys calabaricus TaxID=27687 RepID=UPI00109F3AC6|nr:serine/threonine-protein kinase PLK4 isoform X1 [Erpetoichthys calabaricus]
MLDRVLNYFFQNLTNKNKATDDGAMSNTDAELNIEDFRVLDILGKGSFASVHRAKCLSTDQEVAIKMIDKALMHKKGMVQRVRNEVEIHCQLKDPSILELYSFFEDEKYVYLVLEMCENGEMTRYLKKRKKPFSEDEARQFMRQIVKGMSYLHDHGILHRDLTLSNLLLTRSMNIKIADFGLATRLKLPDEKHFTMCGTPNYISPEIASCNAHGLESDLWSLGCMFYTFLVGKPPFETETVRNTLNKVVVGDYKMPQHVSKEAQNLIYELLRRNPVDRIPLSSVLNHPFMTKPSSRIKDSGIVECSIDSGIATISTGFTATIGSSSNCTSGRFFQKSKQFVAQPLPNRMNLIPLSNGSRNEVLQDNSNAFHHEQQLQQEDIVRDRSGRTMEKSNDRPLSRYLRRAHSSDRCGPPGSNMQDQASIGMENCPSVGVSSESERLQICRNQDNFTRSNSYGDIPQGFKENSSCTGHHGIHGKSPPVKQKANSEFVYHGNTVLQPHRPEPNAAHHWFAKAQPPQDQFHNPVHVTNKNILSESSDDEKQPLSAQNQLFLKMWGDKAAKMANDCFHEEVHTVRQVNRRAEDVTTMSKSENSCQAQMVEPHLRVSRNVKHEKEHLKDTISPLNAKRLKPVRQKVKDAMVSILDTGEVCMEFVKGQSSQERVREVVKISCDGTLISIYHPNEGRGFPLNDRPPSPPEDIVFYSFDDLPEKYWKKYQYASRIVQLLKTKTPKVTLYTKHAKFILMENSPDANLEAFFYNGTKTLKTTEFLKIIEKNGHSYMFKKDTEIKDLSGELRTYVELSNTGHRMCLALEASVMAEESRSEKNVDFFPVVVGRRPSVIPPLSSALPTAQEMKSSGRPPSFVHDSALGSSMSSTQHPHNNPSIISYESSVFTTAHTAKSLSPCTKQDVTQDVSKVLRTVFFSNIGWASQLSNGNVWIQFNDGSQLMVPLDSSCITYTTPQGHVTSYKQDFIPKYLEEKVGYITPVIEHLLNRTS